MKPVEIGICFNCINFSGKIAEAFIYQGFILIYIILPVVFGYITCENHHIQRGKSFFLFMESDIRHVEKYSCTNAQKNDTGPFTPAVPGLFSIVYPIVI